MEKQLPNLSDFVAALSYEAVLKEIANIDPREYIRQGDFSKDEKEFSMLFNSGVPVSPFEVVEFGKPSQVSVLLGLCLVQSGGMFLYAVMAKTAEMLAAAMVAKGYEDGPLLHNMVRTVLFILYSEAKLAFDETNKEPDAAELSTVRFVKVLSITGLLDYTLDEGMTKRVIQSAFSKAGKKEEATS